MDNKNNNHLFFKVNLNAIKNFEHPLIAEIGTQNFVTLCVLAAYMDENKYCYPTQATISRCLGISPQAAGVRVRKLEKCRFKGEPVVEVMKDRAENGQFDNNRYRILTPALSIFYSDAV